MNALPLLLAASLCGSTFAQGTISFEVTGTVAAGSTSLTTAPFQSAAPGDAVTLRFGATTPGLISGAIDTQLYDVAPATIEISVDGTTFSDVDQPEDLILLENPAFGDVLTFSGASSAGISTSFVAIDSTDATFSGVDLQNSLGSYSPASFDQLILSISDGVGALTVDVTGITIGDVTIGESFCGPAVQNSSGQSAELRAFGSDVAAANDLTLVAEGLPSNAFGIVIVSRTQTFTPGPGGSAGNLCLGGSIGRYNRPGDIQSTGSGSSFTYSPNLEQTPSASGFVPINAGETWNFQAWFRDVDAGQVTSNFTQGVEIDFQ